MEPKDFTFGVNSKVSVLDFSTTLEMTNKKGDETR
jgi:hypothetical protein